MPLFPNDTSLAIDRFDVKRPNTRLESAASLDGGGPMQRVLGHHIP